MKNLQVKVINLLFVTCIKIIIEPINSYTSAVNPEVLKEFDDQFQSPN